jgi:hypothetical protein
VSRHRTRFRRPPRRRATCPEVSRWARTNRPRARRRRAHNTLK